MAVDLVLLDGRIWRGRGLGFAEALAVDGGRVAASGDRADMLQFAGPGTRRIDLAGRFALPAFNDPHLHLATLGFSLAELRLNGASVGAVLEQVASAAARLARGSWITGRGYEEAAMGGRPPSLAELDAAAPDNPVLLRRVCGHQFLVNSAALALAGIGDATADPAGGAIERRDGRATGLLVEEAGQLAVRAMPPPGRAQFRAAVARAADLLVSQGVASVMDAAVGRAGHDELAALTDMAADGTLTLRTWVCLYGGAGGVLEQAYAEGHHFGTEIGLLRFGAAKLFADGSVGAATAAFSEAYAVGGNGLLSYPDEEMAALLGRFHALGYQLAIHAIGDAAIGQVLEGMEALPAVEVPGRRHRIEHCGFATPDQMRRMRRLGISPVPQPLLVSSFGDRFAEVLGAERVRHAYPMHTWSEMGFALSASSDAPICTSDPLASVAAMLDRRTASGSVHGPEECVDIETALDAQTRGGAFTQFAEHERGTLADGMLADIAILSGDPFRDDLAAIRCEQTLVAGRSVFAT